MGQELKSEQKEKETLEQIITEAELKDWERFMELRKQGWYDRLPELREQARRIFNLFGNPNYCQICNDDKYLSFWFDKNRKLYSKSYWEVREEAKTHRELIEGLMRKGIEFDFEPHDFKPKYDIPFVLEDEPFYTDPSKQISYRLVTRFGKLFVQAMRYDEKYKFWTYKLLKWYEIPDRPLAELMATGALEEFVSLFYKLGDGLRTKAGE